jgi:antitoxin component of MazEF toxin-antitoxin module
VAEYDAIVKSNAERRTRLTTRLAVVEENLAASMSTELWDDYKRMLE